MQKKGYTGRANELAGIGDIMRVLLTSAGLETEEIKKYFMNMFTKDMMLVKALFIPTAAIDAAAVGVLPKCMNDLLKCGILDANIKVYDLHDTMELDEIKQYDVVYLCGGNTMYLLERINATGFNKVLLEYIESDGIVIGVSAGSLVFADNYSDNLGLLKTKLDVHCTEGETKGKVVHPLKSHIRLTNTYALAIRNLSEGLEIIG